jgi:hypothetical protein
MTLDSTPTDMVGMAREPSTTERLLSESAQAIVA